MAEKVYHPLTDRQADEARAALEEITRRIWPDDPDRVSAVLAEYGDNLVETLEAFMVLEEQQDRARQRRAGRDERGRYVSNDKTVGQAIATIQDGLEAQHHLLMFLLRGISPGTLVEEREQMQEWIETSASAVADLDDLIPLTDAGRRPATEPAPDSDGTWT